MPAQDRSTATTSTSRRGARAALGLVGAVLFLGAAASAVVVALLVASVLAAPFLDVLSRRVEAIVSGRVRDVGEGGLWLSVRAGVRAAAWELRQTAAALRHRPARDARRRSCASVAR